MEGGYGRGRNGGGGGGGDGRGRGRGSGGGGRGRGADGGGRGRGADGGGRGSVWGRGQQQQQVDGQDHGVQAGQQWRGEVQAPLREAPNGGGYGSSGRGRGEGGSVWGRGQQQQQVYAPSLKPSSSSEPVHGVQAGQQWRGEVQAPLREAPSRGGYGSNGRGRGEGGSVWGRGQQQQQVYAQSLKPSSSSEPVHDSPIPEMQSLQIANVLPASNPSDHSSKLVPVRRPDNGGVIAVRSVNLVVNHFPIKFNPESTIWHYDVEVKSEGPHKNGRAPKITKADLCLIRNKLSSDRPQDFPLSMTAYDGEKNIFSAVQLCTGEFIVSVSKGEDTKIGSYKITIKLVNDLKLRKLKDYLTGNLFSIPRDILQGMDVVMKENPTRSMIRVGGSFYPGQFNPKDDLNCGIAASRGFQHSLKSTSQGLVLCLDSSTLAFRKRLPVIEYLQQHIRGFNINDFGKFRRPVEKALKGLKVTVTHRITKQKYIIAGLTDRDTGRLSFTELDPEGKSPPKQVSVVDYFRQKYGKDIAYKNIPCLDLGKNNKANHVPMEFCVLAEGQRFPTDDLDRNAASFLKTISLPQPKERLDRICGMVRASDGPCGGRIAQNFGLEVNPNVTKVQGRVIGPPELKLGATKGRASTCTVDREKCQWNLVGKSVVSGKVIDRWAVIDFTTGERFNQFCPNEFIPKFMDRCWNLGIRMEEPLVYERTTMNAFSAVSKLQALLEAVSKKVYEQNKASLQIIVCVMSRKDAGYKLLKWVSETKIGILTQCCLSANANKANDQYLANLALKLNAKLGGSNVELKDRLPLLEGEGHVMFIGADVNHPGSLNRDSPSIVAVVATINWPAANRYVARVRAQTRRQESIADFGEICLELVNNYAQLNKVRPQKIIIFRDGVSEGQFDMALNEELLDLKRAFRAINYNPTITLVVAQKRHQTRLFPMTQMDGSQTGNVPPGTVVDTTIVHPFEFDFYLCSHYGSLGTSKPTHYYVLLNEHGFSSDQLQKLIYNMCFTFSRCTKPVSLVPPVYYADLAAYRGRLYYDALEEGQQFQNGFHNLKLHGDLENIMFFV